MQTFLPYASFEESAKCLDLNRLNKQRSEALTILTIFLFEGLMESGSIPKERIYWANHPATRMWRGYTHALGLYGIAICKEWFDRGYQENTGRKILNVSGLYLLDDPSSVKMPPWFGDERLHISHRSNLLRKKEAYYRRYGWEEPTDLPYLWPI